MKKIIFLLIFLSAQINAAIGQTWGWIEQSVSPSPPALTCVGVWTTPPLFGFPKAGWLGGANGTILYTSDMGANWFYRQSPLVGTNTVTAIEAVGPTSALLAFRNSTTSTSYILRTTDTGLNWTIVFQQTNGFIRSVRLRWNSGGGSGPEPGFAIGDPVGGRWTILKTTNAGVSFDSTGMYLPQAASEMGTNNSLDIMPANTLPEAVFFGTNNNRVYRSTNLGTTWSWGTVPFQNILALVVSREFSPAVYAGGNLAAKSTDWGTTWTPVTLPGSGDCRTMTNEGYSGRNIWYAKGSEIYVSSNGGQTFVLGYTSPNGGNYTNMCLRSALYEGIEILGWAVRDNGGISRFYALVGGIQKIGTETPAGFELFQNYPNPFNPVTRVRFSVPLNKGGERGLYIRLLIFDLLGREIATLVNESLPPGTYEVSWDGTNYPSGVYLYRFSAENYVETKRMVLLK